MNTATLSVRYMRRRNLGNFEHAELEVTDGISPENKEKGVKELMSFVEKCLFGEGISSVPIETSAKETAPKTPAANSERKVSKPTESASKTTPQQETKKPEENRVAEEPKAEEKKADAPKAEEQKTEKTPAKKTETSRAKVKSKITAYNRQLPEHKDPLGVWLNSEYPSVVEGKTEPRWKQSDNLKKAGAASRALDGKDFLDEEGNILESFKDEFRKFMVDLVEA